MKILLAILILPILFLQNLYAYSLDEVNTHDTPADCWVVFEEGVYDLSKYIPSHDRYMDIRDWCGKDMTQDFKTKAGSNRDHRLSTYSLLENYKIGDISSVKEITPAIDEQTSEEPQGSSENPNMIVEDVVKTKTYNIILPLIISLLVYWIPYFLVKKNIIDGSIKTFNAFWNSILLILLILPSLGFGIFMILRYQFPTLWDITFDFMYWHVELSLVMGFMGLNHFLSRISIYLLQLQKPK